MNILYNYIKYDQPKKAVFDVSFEYGYNENGVLEMLKNITFLI